MADRISKERRSSVMKAIRSKNTSPEMKVRRMLHAAGFRFRLYRKDLPGKPDIIFPSRKKVIFIHGCFWHQHQKLNCPISHQPKSNLEYWLPKLMRTVERDKIHQKNLASIGWSVLTLWECQIQKSANLPNYVVRFLENGSTKV
jgi:DNA mismatch endonuclease (patch repair protein)